MMTAGELLTVFKRMQPNTLRALEARTRDPRHLFVLELVNEIQQRVATAPDGVLRRAAD